MFAANLRTKVVVRVLLISMILLNSLASSTVFAQAAQQTAITANSNAQLTVQENRHIDNKNLSVTFMENVGQFDPRAFSSAGEWRRHVLFRGCDLVHITGASY